MTPDASHRPAMRRIRLAVPALVAVLACGIVFTQRALSSVKSREWQRDRMTFLPRSEALTPLLLGYTSTYANYLWIKTTLYFGGHYLTDKDVPWLVHMVDLVTRLNPRFYPAYEFAALLIPDYCHDIGASRVILMRGMSAFGASNWKLPFYLGWLHYRYYGDNAEAARFLSLAARSRGAPPLIVAFAATLQSRAGDTRGAIEFLKAMYQTTESPAVRQVIAEKLRFQAGNGAQLVP